MASHVPNEVVARELGVTGEASTYEAATSITDDPDVELIARAIAAADGYVNDGWRLCVPAAEAVRKVLGERLVPVGEWEYGAHRYNLPVTFMACRGSLESVGRWVAAQEMGEYRIARRRTAIAIPATPWEEVRLDPDVRDDIADEEVTSP